jgi:lysophospholipase L1-like esterase
MPYNKLSRRSFFEKSLCLAVLPIAYSSLSSFALENETIKKSLFQLVSGGHDLERLTDLIKQKNPMIWVFTGDSITQGAKHTHGYRSYPEIFGERIRWEMGRYRDIVINSGISGNTTQDILGDFDWRISQFKPSVVSLMIGTNDCSKKDISLQVFERNLDSILTMTRELNAIPIFHTPNVIIKEKAPERERLSEYVSVIQNLAGRKDVVLVDNFTYWQNAIQNQGETQIFKEWLNDPLHPNGSGHSEIARLMFKTLSIFDPKASTCNGIYFEGEH